MTQFHHIHDIWQIITTSRIQKFSTRVTMSEFLTNNCLISCRWIILRIIWYHENYWWKGPDILFDATTMETNLTSSRSMNGSKVFFASSGVVFIPCLVLKTVFFCFLDIMESIIASWMVFLWRFKFSNF